MPTLPTMRGKIPPGGGSAAWVNQFSGKDVTVGHLTLAARSIAIVPLRVEIEVAPSFEYRRSWIGRLSGSDNPLTGKI
jgi:hypothetical protein